MLNKLRSIAGKYFLKEKLEKTHRKRKITNLKEAGRIGILYNLDDVPDYEIIAEFVSILQHDHKEVKALGFVKNKNLISRFLPKLSFDFFSVRDLNWFCKPVHSKVKDFIEKDFDILMDLSLKDTLPLKFISALSVAHCRVGRYTESCSDCYDLMLHIGKNMTLKEYIEQIIHYLSVINNNEEREYN